MAAIGQRVMRVDDSGQRRLVGFRADIGVGGPDQLVAGHAVAGGGHAAKTEIGGVGQDCGEKRAVVVARSPVRRLVKADAKPVARFTSCSSSVMRTGQHCVDPVGEGAGIGRGGGLDGRDVQSVVTEFDTVELAAPQPSREAPEPSVELLAPGGQPFIRRGRKPRSATTAGTAAVGSR